MAAEDRRGFRRWPYVLGMVLSLAAVGPGPGWIPLVTRVAAQATLPELTGPVTDHAGVIDQESRAQIEQLSKALQAAAGDVLVVVTVPSFAPYADVRSYAVKVFDNHGRGIGERGRDNGVMILLALEEREVWVEVGYGLEPWITDGFAGETSRDFMVPEFRQQRYGAGLLAGAGRIAGRIAQGRNVTLTGVEIPAERPPRTPSIPNGLIIAIVIMVIIAVREHNGSKRRAMRRALGWPWPGLSSGRLGRSGWSGWSSGVGPFGGRFGGGRSGGFGGFRGGRSGGGGGGARW
jgi:uncharacterized protein